MLYYIAGIKTNIKNRTKIINNTQTANEIQIIVLFFFKTPNIIPKITIIKKGNRRFIKLT